ncbi:helix-turn-helix domain-containing protein [Kordiimonas lipolytica]|jgi:MerR family mercuric resistance operon transcriptional regulator|uniref:Helix-turn-helix domain-containing protein n=1 Tax=Kordiimonas lipolytica TaxID=1662421 RepID=A0ABV8U5V0_9PROT|nr:helix-turn-helix domain-containing protein [Kordiimonas lipolytica]
MAVSQKREFTRGTLAKESGVNLETIRFYEKIGLMPDPPRTASGYRCYSPDHLKRLKFIRRSRELGFTNQEVAGLLEMVDGTYACDDVKDIALAHVALIKNKVADLVKLQSALETMAAECSGGDTPDCVIVDRLLED